MFREKSTAGLHTAVMTLKQVSYISSPGKGNTIVNTAIDTPSASITAEYLVNTVNSASDNNDVIRWMFPKPGSSYIFRSITSG